MTRGAALALAMLGCGMPTAPEPDAGPDPCELESGTYRVDFVRTSGTCVDFDGVDVVLSPGLGPPFPGANDECSGAVDFTPDGCAVEFDRTCDVFTPDGLIGAERWRGVSTIVAPTRVEAGVEFEFNGVDPGDSCRGGYEIAWTRR